ncbi:tripartite tricarboxylate transporter substrate binding protein [Alcaligenaceae bacterium]|nr:tripartite tricarboxylate transporter substrate binding protein [Alcaligenaceae bacterium]
MNQSRRTTLIFFAATAFSGVVKAAVSVPSSIRIIIPWPPGSGGDIAGRLVAQKLGEELHANVYVENRAGASGSIGSALGSREKPDGTTLILGNSASHGSSKFTIPNLAYDPVSSFTPISMLYRNTLVLAVNKDFPADSLPALIDYAKKNPGSLAFGTPGVGTPHQLVGELIKEKAGIDMVHVPYKGSGQIMTDLVGGHINLAVSAQAAALEMHRAGKVKIIATADKERSRQLPEVPAISETFPDFDVAGWGGLFGPEGLAPDLAARYERAVKKIMASPDFMQSMETNGFVPVSSTGDELQAVVQEETKRWQAIVDRGTKL